MEEQRCSNCGLNVSMMQRHSVESEEMLTLLQQWVAPKQVTVNSFLCHSCWMLINLTLVGHRPETRSVGHENVCINCGCSIRRIRKHLLRTDTGRERHVRTVIVHWCAPRIVSESSHICHPCWQRADRAPEPTSEASSSAVVDQAAVNIAEPSSPPPNIVQHASQTIHLPNYIRASNTESHCFFPRCHETDRLVVPTAIRARLFCDYSYVPPNCRICSFHLRGNVWDELNDIQDGNHMFTADNIEDFASLLKTQTSHNIDFENIDASDDHLVHYWLGMTKTEFKQVLQEVPRLNSLHRGPTALAAYLTKLRTGESDQRLTSLFQIPRSTFERLMDNARELLMQDFVPANLGLQHFPRENIVQRNLAIPSGLFGNMGQNAIVIMDGTYIYVQKSTNYRYQKETYSLHKYKNLVKPFMVVCCDGYIIDVLGPYPATTSDAQILINEFAEGQPLRQYFNAGDVFLLDRGFRDAIPHLEECGYSPQTPLSLEEGESQLSTSAANKTRTVTMCRWVVEYVNGIFKRCFKLFRQDYFNRASKHIMKDFSIAAALINRFHTRITDRDDAEQILSVVNQKLYEQNTLADYVIENNLNRRRSQFVNITVGSDNLSDFPRLSMSELILIACGTYQIRQSRSYYGEHIRASGTYSVEVCRETNNTLPGEFLETNCWLLRAKIQSRHIGRKIYFVYILINNNNCGRQAIEQYYCNCIIGKRTVGCCAHIMTIIWYIGWARFERNIVPPAQFLDDILCHFNNEYNIEDN